MRISLTDRSLFLSKTLIVFAVSFALIPLIGLKHDLPALLYAAALVLLHVFVLAIYLYRVRVRELDPNVRSLAVRVLALVVVGYLLFAVSSFEEGASQSTLAWEMLALSLLHTVVLLLLMARVTFGQPVPATPPPVEPPSRN
ncbi:MAG: hypothetical protein QF664_02695 [Dehalococcoidia bacterium]|jgi:cytochrome bd-type quinol oxidase subunit 2|nr:hypothetical protein [Dehalococcoidia bacterium]